MELLLQTLVNGILIGGILACLTIGFQLTFGVLHVIDFAVGGWVMLGGYAAYWAGVLLGVGALVTLPFVFVLFLLIGYALGPLVYRVRTNRYARPELMVLAFTFGLFMFMRGGALWLWSFNTRTVDTPLAGEVLMIGPVLLPLQRVAAFVLAAALSLALFVFLNRTRLGLAVRAVAQNRDHAGLMGVDVKRLSSIVFGIYTGITATAGVLVAAIFSVNPTVGIKYTLFAFFVAVLAGMGSIGGVLVAGLLLGVIQSVVAIYIGASYSLLVVFGTLYLVLLVAPHGILRRGM